MSQSVNDEMDLDKEEVGTVDTRKMKDFMKSGPIKREDEEKLIINISGNLADQELQEKGLQNNVE